MARRRMRIVFAAAFALTALLWSLGIGGSVAWAAGPSAPVVITGSATSVRSTTATLEGSANPRRSATNVGFQYGPSADNYLHGTPAMPIGAGSTFVPFQTSITGLTPGTTYHFRAVARNGNGLTYGNDQTFTTPSASGASAPSVTTGGASALSQGALVVSGTANPHGFATTVVFQYGTSTSYAKATTPAAIGSGTSSVTVHGTLAGLMPGTTYHYRAVATNQNGTSYGADKTVTPTATPTVTSVTTDGATAIQAISATLSGTADPAGTATTVSFEYGTTTAYGGTTAPKGIGSGSATVGFHAAITNLTPGATYHYRAVATSASGTVYGADKTFTTRKKPALITGGASDITDTTATLNGVVNPSGSTTSVSFEYGTDETYGQITSPQQIAGGTDQVTFTAKVTGLTPGTTYHYRAQGTSASGSAVGADITFTTTGDKPTASAPSPTATPTTSSTVTTHPKPTGFDPLLLAGGLALVALVVGGFAVVALARGRR